MKIPLSWIKEFVSIKESPHAIAKRLTQLGIEVDKQDSIGERFDGVIVGAVLEAEPHPNADKLRVATVSDGVNIYQVVCGAPNCRKGLKTAFAPVGASLKEENGEEFKIKKAKLRGVESCGMLCSAAELGLGVDGDGIIELPENSVLGRPLSEIFSDTIFEISLTPNLGHCSSILGIARELSAATGLPLHIPSVELQEEKTKSTQKKIQVTIQDKAGCPRYTCRVIENVKVGPSPDWLKERLEKCGLRSINNVVDVTNYVLLELGHPLHAFDYDAVKGHHIIVNSAQEGSTFTTLDTKSHPLQKGQILISDAERPIALAGVMGGANSEVGEGTKNIVLESAYFDPIRIRRTSKQLGIQSDSSKRFERGTDPNGLIRSLNRAAQLIQSVAGGEISEGIVDVAQHAFLPKSIDCRLSRANQLIGTGLGSGEVENIFQRLGFGVKFDGRDTYHVEVPTYRCDIHAEIDLIEEVARLHGYQNIPKRAARHHASKIPHNSIYLMEKRLHALLMAEGLQEFLTCDLIGPTLLKIAMNSDPTMDGTISVMNPTSIEQSFLRTSLLPGLLHVVKHNVDHQNPDISGYEIGRVHFKEGDNYREQSVFGIVLSGQSRPYHWDPKPHPVDFFDLKGIVENILESLGIRGVEYKNIGLPTLHNGRQASVFIGSLEIGSLGEIHPVIQRRLDVPQPILFAEFNLHDLMKNMHLTNKFQELSAYPCSERDWTLTVDESLPCEELINQVYKAASPLLVEVSLKDIYRSEKLGKQNKNVTLHFTYRDSTKTLEHAVVDAEQARITTEVAKALSQSIRSQ